MFTLKGFFSNSHRFGLISVFPLFFARARVYLSQLLLALNYLYVVCMRFTVCAGGIVYAFHRMRWRYRVCVSPWKTPAIHGKTWKTPAIHGKTCGMTARNLWIIFFSGSGHVVGFSY